MKFFSSLNSLIFKMKVRWYSHKFDKRDSKAKRIELIVTIPNNPNSAKMTVSLSNSEYNALLAATSIGAMSPCSGGVIFRRMTRDTDI